MKNNNLDKVILFFPHRLLFIFPIIMLVAEFADNFIGVFFGVILAFFTGRMFPIFEYAIKSVTSNKKGAK